MQGFFTNTTGFHGLKNPYANTPATFTRCLYNTILCYIATDLVNVVL